MRHVRLGWRFTLRFFPRNAAACALLALAALTVYPQDAPAPETHGIVVASMDHSVKPGDDFYRYANGDWIKRTEIPPDRSDVGGFHSLIDLSQKRIAGLIEEAAKANAPAGSIFAKLPISIIPTWTRPPSKPKASLRSAHTLTPLRPSAISTNWRGLWARASGRMSIL
jgi:Peptidase family M13